MTVFSRTWDGAYEGDPADVEDINLGATRIRNTRVDVRERLAVDHSWDGDAADGMHKQVTLVGAAPVPTSDGVHALLYAAVVSGVLELFYKDVSGHTLQLTKNGAISGTLGDTIITGTLDVSGIAIFASAVQVTATMDAQRYIVDSDVQFYFDRDGSNNPFGNVKANSYWLFDRVLDTWNWIINSTARLIIGASDATFDCNLSTTQSLGVTGTASIGGSVDGGSFIVDSDPVFKLEKPSGTVARVLLGTDTYIEFDRGGDTINVVKDGVTVQTW